MNIFHIDSSDPLFALRTPKLKCGEVSPNGHFNTFGKDLNLFIGAHNFEELKTGASFTQFFLTDNKMANRMIVQSNYRLQAKFPHLDNRIQLKFIKASNTNEK